MANNSFYQSQVYDSQPYDDYCNSTVGQLVHTRVSTLAADSKCTFFTFPNIVMTKYSSDWQNLGRKLFIGGGTPFVEVASYEDAACTIPLNSTTAEIGMHYASNVCVYATTTFSTMSADSQGIYLTTWLFSNCSGISSKVVYGDCLARGASPQSNIYVSAKAYSGTGALLDLSSLPGPAATNSGVSVGVIAGSTCAAFAVVAGVVWWWVSRQKRRSAKLPDNVAPSSSNESFLAAGSGESNVVQDQDGVTTNTGDSADLSEMYVLLSCFAAF
ncbi:hypothetical protein HDU98_001354 [Podochytrium sp. JEL0797]|nr:hypothetical protein HDU98_001354 [Podochytrium sp. JEL0797]